MRRASLPSAKCRTPSRSNLAAHTQLPCRLVAAHVAERMSILKIFVRVIALLVWFPISGWLTITVFRPFHRTGWELVHSQLFIVLALLALIYAGGAYAIIRSTRLLSRQVDADEVQ